MPARFLLVRRSKKEKTAWTDFLSTNRCCIVTKLAHLRSGWWVIMYRGSLIAMSNKKIRRRRPMRRHKLSSKQDWRLGRFSCVCDGIGIIRFDLLLGQYEQSNRPEVPSFRQHRGNCVSEASGAEANYGWAPLPICGRCLYVSFTIGEPTFYAKPALNDRWMVRVGPQDSEFVK